MSLVIDYPSVKHHITRPPQQTGKMLPVAKILAENVDALIAKITDRPPRPQLAARMGIGDKTLGFIKAGTGNPTLENIAKVAAFFRVQPYELLRPHGNADELTSAASQPVSGEDLMMAADVADEALQGLWLPKNRYYELVSLALEGISQGLPYAEILEFIAPAARKLAKSEVTSDDSEAGLGPTSARGHGRRAAAGNR